jgi:hypothetical protein
MASIHSALASLRGPEIPDNLVAFWKRQANQEPDKRLDQLSARISFSAWAVRRESREILSDHGSAFACAVAAPLRVAIDHPASPAHTLGSFDALRAVSP